MTSRNHTGWLPTHCSVIFVLTNPCRREWGSFSEIAVRPSFAFYTSPAHAPKKAGRRVYVHRVELCVACLFAAVRSRLSSVLFRSRVSAISFLVSSSIFVFRIPRGQRPSTRGGSWWLASAIRAPLTRRQRSLFSQRTCGRRCRGKATNTLPFSVPPLSSSPDDAPSRFCPNPPSALRDVTGSVFPVNACSLSPPSREAFRRKQPSQAIQRSLFLQLCNQRSRASPRVRSDVRCTYTRKLTMTSPSPAGAASLTRSSRWSSLRLSPFALSIPSAFSYPPRCSSSLFLWSSSIHSSLRASRRSSQSALSLRRLSSASVVFCRPRPSRSLLAPAAPLVPVEDSPSACAARQSDCSRKNAGEKTSSRDLHSTVCPKRRAPGVVPQPSCRQRVTRRLCSGVRTPERPTWRIAGQALYAPQPRLSLARASRTSASLSSSFILSSFAANFPVGLATSRTFPQACHMPPAPPGESRGFLSVFKDFSSAPASSGCARGRVHSSSSFSHRSPSSSVPEKCTRSRERDGKSAPAAAAGGVPTPRSGARESVASASGASGASLYAIFSQARQLSCAHEAEPVAARNIDEAEQARRRDDDTRREEERPTNGAAAKCQREKSEEKDSEEASETAAEAEDGEPKVYRQREGMIQFVFQWGIGNSFRAVSANRFRPVHAARPKEVSIHPSYFESPHPFVIWEPLNEAWEVYFYENLKKSAKPFPVKKFGIARAKREALLFLEQMKLEGKLEKPTFSSGVDGVTFDQVTGSWICRFVDEEGRCVSRGFGADFHGFEEARKLAIERQAEMKKVEATGLGPRMRLVKEK
ncbi:AP2 domain transcription factor AP2VIIb-2 [Toxoplasma gondii RUB]|uniref:AP2 domain transcription factor AP2VIIb-2 n=1 Tax=Toxoplasma gondii RUB TaxID=935652 RepID=A0A086M976_TOXGO|nr:AP2 domain transcription factor AP2VIIb-2 [Toxoplasma gondii RUB]